MPWQSNLYSVFKAGESNRIENKIKGKERRRKEKENKKKRKRERDGKMVLISLACTDTMTRPDLTPRRVNILTGSLLSFSPFLTGK